MASPVRISLLVTCDAAALAPLVLEDLHTGARQTFDGRVALLAALESRLPRQASEGAQHAADPADAGIGPA